MPEPDDAGQEADTALDGTADEFGFLLFDRCAQAFGCSLIRLCFGLGFVHRLFKRDGLLDRRLSCDLEEAERKQRGHEAGQHSAHEQFPVIIFSYQWTNRFTPGPASGPDAHASGLSEKLSTAGGKFALTLPHALKRTCLR